MIGVFTAPGDRCNETLTKLGRVMSEVDYLVLREDQDLRGRQPGEVCEILKSGAAEKAEARIFPDEESAIEHALEVAEPGDWVVINYEKLQYSYEALNRALSKLGWEQLGTEFSENRSDLRSQHEETLRSISLQMQVINKQMLINQGSLGELEGLSCWQQYAGES